mmetsp:Transcript_51450/g.120450  ORF Transcript_51450/g.120450 Transcript_51450/m.120450 type:complete len:221 (+) Transcript_51450:1935-2597(+)
MASPTCLSNRCWSSSFRKTLLRPICQDCGGSGCFSRWNFSSISLSSFRQSSLKSGSIAFPAVTLGQSTRKRLKNSLKGLRTEYPARRIRIDSSIPAHLNCLCTSMESNSCGRLLAFGLMHRMYLGLVLFKSSTSWSSCCLNIMLTVTFCLARSGPPLAPPAGPRLAAAGAFPAGDPALPSPANCGSENRFFSNVKEDDFKRLVMSTWSLSVFFSKKETTS